jgi:hypothetical protein
MDRSPFLPRLLLALAALGAGGWALLSRTAAVLDHERADLARQTQRLGETDRRLASAIVREETAQAETAEKEASAVLIRQAIREIARLPVVTRAPMLPAPPPPPRGPRDDAMFAELLDDPEYARLCITALRQDVDERDGAILLRLRDEPTKTARLTQLLIERRLVAIEAEHLAFRQGLSYQHPEAVFDAHDQLEAEIRTQAGDELYDDLK